MRRPSIKETIGAFHVRRSGKTSWKAFSTDS